MFFDKEIEILYTTKRKSKLGRKMTLKKISTILLAIASLFCLERFCHKQTDGFKIRNLRIAPTSHQTSLPTEKELKIVKEILSQPLTYIGRGGQCYAFTTKDNLHVVKLLKYNNNYPRIWFRLFPFPFGLESYRQNKLTTKQKKLAGEYKSYEIAFSNLKEETGIVFFHLEKTPIDLGTIEIQDKLRICHKLPANKYQFYIQKKGTPLYPGIEKMLQEGNLFSAKKAITELVSFLVKRCEKKITDGDDGIWRNFAFQNNHPFQIDIGQFSYRETLANKEEYKKDLLFFTKDFYLWLSKTSPELAQHLIDSINTETDPSQ